MTKRFDNRIYSGPQRELGVYGTRRYPKGSAGGMAPLPESDAPFDPNRNPIPIHLVAGFPNIAPHAATTRFTYTVPPKRRARLENAFVHMDRFTVAAPVGRYSAAINLRRAGSTIVGNIARRSSQDNAVGNSQAFNHPGGMELFEGDVLSSFTEDVSTGGSVNFDLAAFLIEYDAIARTTGLYAYSGSGGNDGGGGGSIIRPGFTSYGGFGYSRDGTE